jgi:hypothetical protein
MANPDRKGGGGLSLQTLVIASLGSVTAAMVTSRLFPPGTVYASAVTPVIVAAVSEALNRPAARASELARQRRAVVTSARRRQAERVLGGESHPLRGAPDFAQGAAADEELGANGDGAHARPGLPGEVRIHRTRRWGRIHPKVVVVTGLVAFAIAVAVVTLPELVFGGAVATTHRTTFFGGGASSTTKQTKTNTQTQTQTQTTTTQSKTVTETVPAQTPTTDTATTPTSTDTTPQTTPTDTQTQPTPTDTTTSTTPAPGAAPPTP